MDFSQHLQDLFLRLIRISATSRAEQPVADFIREYLAPLDVHIRVDDAHQVDGGNTGNVICERGSGGDIVLLAHLDTAAPTHAVQPQLQTDRITSDGHTILGADDRAGVAILLFALEKASRQKDAFKDFTVAFTICEETSLSGSKHLSLGKHIKRGYAFDSSLRPGNFIHHTFGAQRFTVNVHGKAAHAGLEPEKGVNAIRAASVALSHLPTGRISADLVMNIGTISGGSAVNVVPAETEVKGEVRGARLPDVQAMVDQIEERFTVAAGEAEARVDFKAAWDFEPYKVDSSHQVYRELVTAMERTGLEAVAHRSSGGSDANSLNAKGIPALNVGIGAQNPHGHDEFILIEDLLKSAEIVLELLKR